MTTNKIRDRNNKVPKVLQVLPELNSGGVERGTVDVTEALTEIGWKAIIVSSGGAMVREVERAGGLHISLPVNSKNPFVMRQNVKALSNLIRSHNIGLVHARSRAPAWTAKVASDKCSVPLVTTFHGTYNYNNAIKKAYNEIMVKGDRVIAISKFIGQHITDHYSPQLDRIRIIPRGVDLDRFNPEAVTAERMIKLAESWRLPDGAPVIMLPGRLTRWKGQSVLIEAAKRLKRQDIRVLLVGEEQGRSAYRTKLEEQISRIGAEGIIHLTGPCSDMPAAYMLADVVISASTDPEAFGRVAAEAHAMGRPVIASDHGGARETVIAGETGWLVPPGDSDAIAQALRTALAMTKDEREKVAQRAMKHVTENFNKTQMCQATLNVYNELIHQK